MPAHLCWPWAALPGSHPRAGGVTDKSMGRRWLQCAHDAPLWNSSTVLHEPLCKSL